MRPGGALAASLLFAGCATSVPDAGYARCAAESSSDWQARWTDGPKPRLAVSGKVTVPTGGYRVALERGPVQALEPPTLQVVVRTKAPEGMATQALTTHDVAGEFAAPPEVGAVAIRCGDGTLAVVKIEPAA